jgi:hypothetical protein
MILSRLCPIAIVVFAVAYLFALASLVIGTFGLFGSEPDPLAAVFIIPLGLPWNRMLDVFPESWLLWLAVLAPAVNFVILLGLCRIARGRPASATLGSGNDR